MHPFAATSLRCCPTAPKCLPPLVRLPVQPLQDAIRGTDEAACCLLLPGFWAGDFARGNAEWRPLCSLPASGHLFRLQASATGRLLLLSPGGFRSCLHSCSRPRSAPGDCAGAAASGAQGDATAVDPRAAYGVASTGSLPLTEPTEPPHSSGYAPPGNPYTALIESIQAAQMRDSRALREILEHRQASLEVIRTMQLSDAATVAAFERVTEVMKATPAVPVASRETIRPTGATAPAADPSAPELRAMMKDLAELTQMVRDLSAQLDKQQPVGK